MNTVKSKVQSSSGTAVTTDQHTKKITPYVMKLKPGEKVLMDVRFSAVPSVFYYIAAAIILIVVQRVSTSIIVTALTGMMCMVTAFEIAKVVLYVQASVALVTNERIIGISGEVKFDINLKKVKHIKSGTFLLIDGGPFNYVKLKYLKKPGAVVAFIQHLTGKK